MTELLAPAGDLLRLKTAVMFGADAVYVGGKQFSLRARASNFSLEDIAEGARFAHEHGARLYVTVNIIPHNSDFAGLEDYLRFLQSIEVDGIICASQAICAIARRVAPQLEIHISTQQTTVNAEAVRYWQRLGADRVVLGRELNLEEIADISAGSGVELEVFIHGGMCSNYSGRCTISNLLTNRDANRGGCAQSCRWSYHLYHDGELLDRDDCLFSMGSKDLCALESIEDLLKLNISSLKIEGRMKTAYYLATVIKGYRSLIDAYYRIGRITSDDIEKAGYYISLSQNRESFGGFFRATEPGESQIYHTDNSASQIFIANVREYDEKSGKAVIEVRNNFRVGSRLAILKPYEEEACFTVSEMCDLNGEPVEVANRPMQLLRISVPVPVDAFSFIYLKEETL